ncbi:MAG: asparagine synthase (glutamine-hydrolyzing) [Crocinitomicaceae bacterium]|nr:asparagine synthase (glutamine-hydrolyzing) [Crocinitomicaceae bacterium]
MTDALIHRGPDGEGVWLNATENVGLGHRRLAITDLSSLGHQPMISQDGRYVITFNGEIYNYIELREKLKKEGHFFRTENDTEVLLKLFQLKGPDCLQELDGMFAFAIWDNEASELFCARDRFGEKPFYYYHSEKAFYFASEMKALFAAGVPCDPDKEMIANYLLNDLVIDPMNESSTFFKGIKKIETGSWLKLAAENKLESSKYYKIQINPCIDSGRSSEDKLFDLLSQSVSRRMRSDVPLGSSLSGGLDSSILVYLIQNRQFSNPDFKNFVSFSARFNDPEYSENEYLDSVLSELKLANKSVYPNSQLIHEELPKVFYHQEEPFISSSILNQWAVMRLARENNVTVLLDGQGADELLAGYSWYNKVFLSELYVDDKQKLREELRQREKNEFEKLSLQTKDILKIYFKSGANNVNQIKNYLFKKTGSAFFSTNAFWFNILDKDFINFNKIHLPITPSYPANLNEVLKLDFSYILEPLLRYADRNSMAFGREVRLPYLSHELVDYCFTLNSSEKIKGGWQKFVLRKMMDKKLPDKVIWRRKKMGFGAPEKSWLDDPMNRDFVNENWLFLQGEGVIKKNVPFNSNASWKIIMVSQLIQMSKKKFNIA